eukprot:745708-Hanusia_phi.AAC.6
MEYFYKEQVATVSPPLLHPAPLPPSLPPLPFPPLSSPFSLPTSYSPCSTFQPPSRESSSGFTLFPAAPHGLLGARSCAV